MQSLLYVPMDVVGEVDVLFVGSFPTEHDAVYGAPFADHRNILRSTVRDNLELSNIVVGYTHTIKVSPDKDITEDELYSWLPSLRADIIDSRPLMIVAIGTVACRAVRLLSDQLGNNAELAFMKSIKQASKTVGSLDNWKLQISGIVSYASTLKQSRLQATAVSELPQSSTEVGSEWILPPSHGKKVKKRNRSSVKVKKKPKKRSKS